MSEIRQERLQFYDTLTCFEILCLVDVRGDLAKNTQLLEDLQNVRTLHKLNAATKLKIMTLFRITTRKLIVEAGIRRNAIYYST